MSSVRGFTLIEVLIAMAIFALVGMASFSVFNAVTDSDVLAKERSKQVNEIQRAMIIIERDFIQLSRRSIRVEGGEPSTSFLHVDDSQYTENINNLAFTRLGWRNPGLMIPRSDVQSVGYYWDEETESLMRAHFNYVDAVSIEDRKEQTLLTEVSELSFEFFDGEKWLAELDISIIPSGIAIIIEHKSVGKIRRQFLLPSGVI